MKLNVIGPVNKLGYGIHVSNMIKSFQSIDVNTSLSLIGDMNDADRNQYLDKALKADKYVDAETLYMFHDTHMHMAESKDIIAFSVFETTKLSPVAVNNLQTYAKTIFTPTQYHKNILINNGLDDTKIHVVNEGIDPTLFNTKPASKLIDTDNYTYLLLGKNEKRKNTSKVLTSFIQTMQYENVSLICHTYNYRSKPTDLKNWYDVNLQTLGYAMVKEDEHYIKFSNSFSDIYFTKPNLTNEQMKELYISANVGISYSSAEGWGLPEMEMMTCGKPVIISNVIGHQEYIKDMPVFNDLIIEPTGVEVATDGVYFNGDVGTWSVLSVDVLNEKLKYVFDNNIGDGLSQELSDYYIKNYSWEKAAITIKNILFKGENYDNN